ncbi:FAD-dependent oxidoreductase [Hahella sp. SMD15-11]|uniref:Sulfide-quinone reductase n=1 Tax=Thermohahella caldifontis TaxID=3142973 RepID=A0AB39UVQ2_9GAMM
MAHVVVIGAGTGGMPCAYELRDALKDQAHEITLINERPDFQFVPSNPWIAVGWREPEQISFPIEPHLRKRKINFKCARVDHIDAKASRLELSTGETLDYDYLVIATGPQLDFSHVPGTGPEAGTASVCTLSHAIQAHEDFQALVRNPGPVVVGALPGASCFGPAYEYAFIVHKALADLKIRDKVPMYYVTPEPYIGHLGLAGVGDSKTMLESALRHRHIQWITNAKVTRAEEGVLYVDELNENGELKKQHELPYRHSMLLPAFKGVDAVASVPDLCNPKGFVITDEYQRSPVYPNIYAIGVCVAIPPVEATPVPTGTPKTGYMIESMVTAVVHNIQNQIEGKAPDHKPSLAALCLADMGDSGAAFLAMPQIPPRNVTWYKEGRWAHWAKVAFEKYFIHKMKTGKSEPFYEKLTLRAVGLTRLKDKVTP